MGLNLSYSPGQTPINEEEKDGLKIKTIVNQTELDEFEQLNIEKAIAWTIQQKLTIKKILSAVFIKNLHKRMFGDVWRWAGNFRNSEKNLGVPWTQINIELHKLLTIQNSGLQKNPTLLKKLLYGLNIGWFAFIASPTEMADILD